MTGHEATGAGRPRGRAGATPGGPVSAPGQHLGPAGLDADLGDEPNVDLGDGRVLVPVLAERLLEAGAGRGRSSAPPRGRGRPGRTSSPVPDRAPRRPLERPLVDRLPGQANWPLRLKVTALGVLLLVAAGNVVLDLPWLGVGTSPVAVTATRWPMVQRGSSGTAVRTVQYLLVSRGYKLAIDGIFGPETEGEVRRYQRARYLRVDGIVGPETWSHLVVDTQRGLEANYVRAVQSELSSSGLPTAVDGIFGPVTEGNVRTFQRRNGIEANGVVDTPTWNRLARTRPRDPRGIGFEAPAPMPPPNGGHGGQTGTLPATK